MNLLNNNVSNTEESKKDKLLKIKEKIDMIEENSNIYDSGNALDELSAFLDKMIENEEY